MDIAIVSAEIVCLIVTFIVGYAIIIDKMKTTSNMYIFGCICCTFMVLLCDALSYILEGNPNLNILLTITNLSTFIFGDFLMFFFSLYIWSIVNEKKPIKKIIVFFACFVGCIDVMFEIFGAITNNTFEIINGVFVPGPFYDYCFVFQLITLAGCLVHIIAYIRILGRRSLIIFAVYYFFPTVAIILILINPDYSFVCSSLSISFLFVYIGIEKESKDRLMLKMANTDVLTNLMNRNSYEARIERYTNYIKPYDIGVAFFDVNGLKYINDNQGHAEGDKLIIKFSNMLIDNFNSHEIYRISGDEFVVIFSNVKDEDLHLMIDNIKKDIANNDHIASCGYAFGSCNKIIDLIMSAEKQMYDDKTDYYNNYGKNRRRVLYEETGN